MTMKPETLEALRGSIAKWQAIVDGREPDAGVSNCPLCHLFYREGFGDPEACHGCPVFEKTRAFGCSESPYITEWARVCSQRSDNLWPWKAETDDEKAAARLELAFLQSLLPKEEQK